MTRTLRSLILVGLLAPGLTSYAAAVPNKLDSLEVKRELSKYFANIAENSPTVLGGISKSPETMAAVQKRIDGMSDQELAGFKKLMADTPDWRIAPEMFAKAFPPDVLAQVKRVGKDFVARAPVGEEMREDVQTLATVLKLLPDAKLKELGIDRTMVTSLEATFDGISPLEAAMLHRQATEKGSWDASSAAALGAIPPALQRGAAALAEHGPLTEKDVTQLTSFRSELTGLLARIDKLPADTRKTLKVEDFRLQMKHLDTASPDMLFMVRHHVPADMLTTLEENVVFLERVANLSAKEKKELAQFRTELTTAFKSLDTAGEKPTSDAPEIEEMLAGLQPAHLMLLKEAMSTFGNWQTALPIFYNTLRSPELPARLALLEGPTPDPAAVKSLEMFRQQIFAEIDTVATSTDVEAALVNDARGRLAATPLKRLELMRMALDSMPASASSKDRLSVVAMHEIDFNCAIDMPSPIPDISLDFICNPIEDALEAIEHGIIGTVNSIVASVKTTLDNTISSISNALTSAVNTVTSTVNSLISSITSTVTNISSFIQTIPALAWDAIKTALNLLLNIEIRNGVTLRDLVARGAEHGLTSMKTLLGLASGWWTAVSTFTLPQIPCPPSGFHTPFGTVGDGAASANYGRYKLMISNLVGMIPDTETSLAVKIPAQVLYMMYDFLGVCLDQASAAADSAQTTARHGLVLSNFAALQTHVQSQVAGLALQSGNQTTALTNLINAQTSATQGTIVSEGSIIQSLLTTKNASTQSLINSESDSIQSLVRSESSATQSDLKAFKTLNLRLSIERVLQAGEGREIALFQLLEPQGHLRLVADIVRETIVAMTATNQGIGQAQALFDQASQLMFQGKEKDAFKAFGKAYRDAVK